MVPKTLKLALTAALLGAIMSHPATGQAATRDTTPHAASHAPRRVTRLLGVYDGKTGEPLAGAQVVDLLARSFVTTTQDGSIPLHFLQVQHDSAAVMVRKLGYRDSTFVVMATDTTSITLMLEHIAVDLPEVLVTAAANPRGYSGLTARCEDFHGSCFTPARIAEHPGAKLTEFLQRANGVKPECARARSTGGCEVSMRKSAGPGRCSPDIFVDGHPWMTVGRQQMEELENFFNGQNIKAIEVYEGDLPKPLAFSSQCGVIVIWTK